MISGGGGLNLLSLFILLLFSEVSEQRDIVSVSEELSTTTLTLSKGLLLHFNLSLSEASFSLRLASFKLLATSAFLALLASNSNCGRQREGGDSDCHRLGQEA